MSLENIAKEVRRETLRQIWSGKSGHPGGSLSCTEILVTLYCKVMQPQPYVHFRHNADVFILSKGHACPAWYALLKTLFSDEVIDGLQLRRLGNEAQGHPSLRWLPEVNTSTGSLGQGFAVGVGMAKAFKDMGSDQKVYVLIGDGEMHEGIVAESARIASYYQLDNLICIMDYNKHQSDKYSAMMVRPVEEFRAWGWMTCHVDGHNFIDLQQNISFKWPNAPSFICAHTVKGNGVSWMEGPDFHGSLTLTDDQLEEALKELE